MATWPPQLADLKADLKVPDGTQGDDAVLQSCLDAAVAKVCEVRSDVDYGPYPMPGAKVPDADLLLGTIRLAGRWFIRRRSPDALVNMGDMGSARIPSFDPDIERLLGIGRFRGPVFA
ncbi:phage gp6-like head-tail connector protein [Amycolatopsis sp. FDAARGOS 1241]|uniref:phage gp6-like head-tail connector protein n=1 Tax=Amycolatopsis sp. FDAARGOS 1241 TaxID=2778070 RepID=UPI0019503FB5|nr:phage gp6-like head-tail connector protein [Amycolatopsis sp. FDAARGOS 1241]QRP48002.1 phage gp6-like head-tail connector protein [Amycolatopsis sp. FDAARGOS 1241]